MVVPGSAVLGGEDAAHAGGEVDQLSRLALGADHAAVDPIAEGKPQLSAPIRTAVQQLEQKQTQGLLVEGGVDEVVDPELPQALAQRQKILAVHAHPGRIERNVFARLQLRQLQGSLAR